jgi:hypothetical protein
MCGAKLTARTRQNRIVVILTATSEDVRAVMINNPARRHLRRLQIAGRLRHIDLDHHPAGEVGRQCGESADKINITATRFGPHLVGPAG